MRSNNFADQVEEAYSNLDSKEQMLGKGLIQPNTATNSGSRKIMMSTHTSHHLTLSQAQPPYISTGFENMFGDHSSSIINSSSDLFDRVNDNNKNDSSSSHDKPYLSSYSSPVEVIAKISKFSYAPNHHYYLIVKDSDSNSLDVIERVSYKYQTECYGFLYNNSVLDSYSFPGSIIPPNTILRRSTGFDAYGNKADGYNINTAYMALDHNMEDSVIISDTCSEKLSAPLIRNVEIILNENDIPLNIYGDDNIYKVFPDIGEDVKDGILLAYRREKREEAIYTQSVSRLQQIMMSDDKITIKGKVIDIQLYCNNPEYISKSTYNQQFYAYYQDRIRMCTEIMNVVGPYKTQGYNLSYRLDKLYSRSISEVNGKKFMEKKLFSNIRIEFTVMENRPLGVGDKVADRYGGKGVISKIIPNELMPKMANGMPIEMIKNSSTMYNRENAGQIFELEINYISMCILDRIKSGYYGDDIEAAMDEILKFVKLQSPVQYEEMKKYIDSYDIQGVIYFLESILQKTCIPISNNPMSETMDIDKLKRLYEEFPWVNQSYLMVPIVDSKGNYRFVKSRRPVIAAPIYCLRLKQFAEEKFSAASLSSTNIKNENAKSKASKNYREPNSNTPIKFGQMESGDFDHMGTEYVVINLLLHSLSPHGRRLVEQAAIGDPYNVDIKLDSKSKNRSAEILNTRLKAMGYRLVFKKIKKHKKYTLLTPALEFFERSPEDPIEVVDFMEEGYDFDKWYKTLYEIEKIKKNSVAMINAISFTEDSSHVPEDE